MLERGEDEEETVCIYIYSHVIVYKFSLSLPCSKLCAYSSRWMYICSATVHESLVAYGWMR